MILRAVHRWLEDRVDPFQEPTDLQVVLDGGRIVEEGTHEQLVARDGLYARLWKRQSGGFLYQGRISPKRRGRHEH